MKINLKNLGPVGFKSTALFQTKLGGGLFYRKKGNRVEFANSHHPEGLGVFSLTKAQMRQFEAGKLSLVPPGCCNPSGGKSLHTDKMVYIGKIRSIQHLEEVFAAERHRVAK